MTTLARFHAFDSVVARVCDPLQPPVLLGIRVWVSWQFLASGWLKLTTWDTTIELFRSEYRVPLLAPELAAVAGTIGELVFPVLLVAGLFTRVGALGLFAVNAVALASYWHVLGADGFEAARGQHYLWGLMLIVLIAFGGGRWSVDALRGGRAASR